MNRPRYIFSLVLAITLAALAVGFGPMTRAAQAQGPDEAAASCTAKFQQKWLPKGNCKTDAAIHFLGTLDNQPLVFKTNAAERMRIDAGGNVGIGLNNPGAKLTVAGLIQSTGGGYKFPDGTTQTTAVSSSNFVLKSGSTMTGALNLPANGLIAGTNQLVLKGGNVGIGAATPNNRLTVSGAADISSFLRVGGNTGGAGLVGDIVARRSANTGAYYFGDSVNNYLYFDGSDYRFNRGGLKVNTSDGKIGLYVNNEGLTFVRPEIGNTLGHLCYVPSDDGLVVFSNCSSTAQYVPTNNTGFGFPEAADLVAIAPNQSNPTNDPLRPFTVQKAAVPCDPNLLGFISNPELGADGTKVNDRYLPLALSGSLPANVSIENGFIHRGDPITSSSKPGYGMKATGVCKIIGYALEDANAEGTIQVFADLGESTMTEVATLRGQMDALSQENLALKNELASIEARLAALELVAPTTKKTSEQIWMPQ